jgi:hypothetical protein
MLVPINASRVVGNGLYYGYNSGKTTVSYLNSNTSSASGTYPIAPVLSGYTVMPINGNNTGNITIPNDGNYQLTLRWWGTTTAVRTVLQPYITSAYLMVYNVTQNKAMDEVEYYVTTAASVNTSTSPTPFTFTVGFLAASVKAGDILRIMVRPSIGNTNSYTTPANGSFSWQTGSFNDTRNTFYPSLLVVQQ